MQHSEKATEVMPTIDEEVTLQSEDDHEFLAFLTYPTNSGDNHSSKAILLMSDIMGCRNEDTRGVAKRLSSIGFPTIVPDQFRNQPWTEGRSMAGYEEWRAQHDFGRVRGDMRVAREYLKTRGFGPGVGLLGFCFGGGRVMEEVARGAEGLNPETAVAFYPTRFDGEYVGRNASCPMLLVTGDEDELVPMSVVGAFENAIKENDKVAEYRVDVYIGFGHAFAHHPSSDADKEQAEVALGKMEEWFRKHL